MTTIRRADAEALATFVRRLRPDWNQAGTVAAIGRTKSAALSEVAVALIRLAEDGSIKTPEMLNSPGHWWFRAARNETPAGEAIRNRDLCPEHPKHERLACPQCAAEIGTPIDPAQGVAIVRKARQEAIEAHQAENRRLADQRAALREAK